jgi:hypothetical protein
MGERNNEANYAFLHEFLVTKGTNSLAAGRIPDLLSMWAQVVVRWGHYGMGADARYGSFFPLVLCRGRETTVVERSRRHGAVKGDS